jgi:hypothetical protein
MYVIYNITTAHVLEATMIVYTSKITLVFTEYNCEGLILIAKAFIS